MKTTFTSSEDDVLQEMYSKLSPIFGITLIENRLTLRLGKGKYLRVVHMVIEDVDPGMDTTCYLCGEKFNGDHMYDANVTVDGCGDGHKFTAKLCYDCYCPQ